MEDLIKRLKESMSDSFSSAEEEIVEENKSSSKESIVNTENKTNNQQKVEQKNNMDSKNNFSFQDVESALDSFDGGKNKNSKM